MSATNRGAVRADHDFYATPEWCTKLIVDRINWAKVETACEPCRGDGDIVSVCPKDLKWICYEIREGWDYLKSSPKNVDLTITNPPYNQAMEFLNKSVEHSRCMVYLLRLNFLGSMERQKWLSLWKPTHLYILSKRPSFVDVCAGDKKHGIKSCGQSFSKKINQKSCPCGGKVKAGTDATEYAWIVWDTVGIMKDLPGIYFL